MLPQLAEEELDEARAQSHEREGSAASAPAPGHWYRKSRTKVECCKRLFARFAGPMTREDAEKILSKAKSAAYLVRDSDFRPGDLSLSINVDDVVNHIKIRPLEVMICS